MRNPASKEMPSQDELLRQFMYDADTGVITRRITTGYRSKQGMVVGYKGRQGYLITTVKCRPWLNHRLIWMMVHGREPSEIDHINGVRTDNRISNLRECNRSENMQNQRLRRDNKSGYPGVFYREDGECWIAYIAVNRTRTNLGRFDSAEAAYEAYLKAKSDLHKFQAVPRAA
jgi:hypothetical protein